MAGGEQPDFVFVHLSDIHFRAGKSGDVHDEDADLRNELGFDLRAAGNLVPRVDAIVVSGDIAFAGKAEEYQTAAAWLRSISDHVGCPTVLVAPGNHDVDRSRLPVGCDVLGFHQAVQEASSLEHRDALIAERLRDASRGAASFSPLEAYNAFANSYGCAVSPSAPYWERPFQLSDGSELCMRGISSTLISGPRDDELPQNLAYGAAQRTFLRAPGVRRMLVGHHPPSWTTDSDTAAQAFAVRNLVQLFGHRHAQWIAKDGNSVRIIAGAVHPDRRESQWEPRFNIVSMSLPNPTSMRVRVFPRRWSREEMIFIADRSGDGSVEREHVLAIEKFERPARVQVPRNTHATVLRWGVLADRLARLGSHLASTIASELGLFSPNNEQPLQLVAVAVTAGKLDDLESKIGKHEEALRESASER